MEFRLPTINKVFIVGNLLNDPRQSVTSTNVKVVNFRIASNKKFKTSRGEKKDKVCFVNVVAWARLAEIVFENLRKGDAVFIEGEIQSQPWIAQSGEKKLILEILANRIQFLTKKDFSQFKEQPLEEAIEDALTEEQSDQSEKDRTQETISE